MTLETLRVPMFCPVCSMVMKGSRSLHTYYEHRCCMHCHIQWVEGREERWKSGWRPSQEDLDKFHSQFHS